MQTKWFDYNDVSSNSFLRSFIQNYNYDKPEEFQINYNNEDYYSCRLKVSDCFKGMVYIEAVELNDGTKRNFAIGDDKIIAWTIPQIMKKIAMMNTTNF